jgi:hypothetical protein
MQGYCIEDGVAGIEDVKRWANWNAIRFISDTVTATSLAELKEVRRQSTSLFSYMIY